MRYFIYFILCLVLTGCVSLNTYRKNLKKAYERGINDQYIYSKNKQCNVIKNNNLPKDLKNYLIVLYCE